jgi:adenylate kinase
MLVLLTGTPGTGKSTLSELLVKELRGKLVKINQLVEEKNLYTGHDPEKGYLEVDLNALKRELLRIVMQSPEEEDFWIIIEGHLSHYFPTADLVIVLRTNPCVLEERLIKRGWDRAKIHENLEAEALDVCTWEAFQIHGDTVHEMDTTIISPEEAVKQILKIINGEKTFPVGNIDFTEFLES